MDTNHADAEDWLERALKADAREHAAAYVSDDGFTAKVMSRLPAPATLPAWRRPILALLWLVVAGAIAMALPELFYDVFRSLVAMVVGQPLTLSRIAVVIVLLAVTTWSTIVYAMRAE